MMAPFTFSSRAGAIVSASLPSAIATRIHTSLTNAVIEAATTNQNDNPRSAMPSEDHVFDRSSSDMTLCCSRRKNSVNHTAIAPRLNSTARVFPTRRGLGEHRERAAEPRAARTHAPPAHTSDAPRSAAVPHHAQRRAGCVPAFTLKSWFLHPYPKFSSLRPSNRPKLILPSDSEGFDVRRARASIQCVVPKDPTINAIHKHDPKNVAKIIERLNKFNFIFDCLFFRLEPHFHLIKSLHLHN